MRYNFFCSVVFLFHFFSVSDIISDVLLFYHYLEKESFLNFVPFKNDSSVLNITGSRTCTLVEQKEAGYLFSCREPVLTGLTLALIYWPALKMMATLLGPRTAGQVGIVWGLLMTIVGVMVETMVTGSNATAVIGWFLMCIGIPFLALSIVLIFIKTRKEEGGGEEIKISALVLQFAVFPLLLPFIPLIFVATKLLSVLKPKNIFLRSQATVGSRGEAILEAAPQFVLQCYVVLLSLSPTWIQLISIATSALTLSLPNIEQFVTTRSEEFGPKSILKNIAVFFPVSLFKLLTLSILCVFLKFIVNVNIFMTIQNLLLAIPLLMGEEKKSRHQFCESIFLSWVTITNLGQGKTAALYRLVTTIFWTVSHSLTLLFILVVCNTDPEAVVISRYFDWSNLVLVQELSTLNTLLVSTLCLGWLSLVLDVLTAAVKYRHCKYSDKRMKDLMDKTVLWDYAILLEGIKY